MIEVADTIDMSVFTCNQCLETKPIKKEGGTGYAKNDNNQYICYDCCGINDRKALRDAIPGDLFTHYLSKVYMAGHYTMKVKNDYGTMTIGTYATSPDTAIHIIMEAEHCPRTAIRITEYPQHYYQVSNWPGTMKIGVRYYRQSFYNMAGKNGRTDIWFNYEGKEFWGVNIGDNDILRIKAIKKK